MREREVGRTRQEEMRDETRGTSDEEMKRGETITKNEE